MTEVIKKKSKKPFIPRSKDPKLNLYSPDDIIKAGGLAEFSKLIGNDKPISPPHIHFTDEEWNEMMKFLD
ncbi:hypothetical protein Emtol_3123 [Emticicia oligotrophica DSM 17448]|uniref:Uncharacterized protein n=1 Tax=Emticicia oligotrophica (strain DSM 17448 / CIP 109782 / MTCC 6937 / GPTSA100-15) TaxID=929562 RepID=A0ABM5N463_EMTOG|nr:hypothetical protein [Emticicia oligotrophica]AFK04256.1 hypothetical protein Emtol_3123 [Emticicia oligotrophica DSM 17448]